MKNIESFGKLQQHISQNTLSLGYFSTPQCNVCKTLLPKVKNLLAELPEISPVYVDVDAVREAAGQFLVYAVPTIIVFGEGRELLRKSRFVGIAELRNELTRLVQILTS
jgi:thioredoxin-like negative regulator of GroEL